MSKAIYTTSKKSVTRTLRNVDEGGHFAQVRMNKQLVNVYEVFLSGCEDFIWVTKAWMNSTTLKFVRLDDED